MMKIDDDDWLIVMMIFDDDGVDFDGDCKVDDDDWLLTPFTALPWAMLGVNNASYTP